MMLTQEEIRANIVQAGKMLHAQSAWLFGSYARGEATEGSDVDILFVVQDLGDARMQYMLQARKLLRSWKVAKDVLVYDSNEFEGWKQVNGALCYNIVKEGVLCYEA